MTAPATTPRRAARRGAAAHRQDDELASAAERAVRSVINRHELSSGERLPSSIAVVGAHTGDGVSTVADALARVLATDFGSTVCLLDLSDDQPAPTRPGDEPRPAGIYEVLTGAATLDDVRRATDHPGVQLVSIGDVAPDQASAIARWSEFELLVARLGDEVDFLVWDTPPLLGGGATLALLRHAGAHLLVARWGRTTQSQLRQVTAELSSLPAIGTVLNRERTATPRLIRRILQG